MKIIFLITSVALSFVLSSCHSATLRVQRLDDSTIMEIAEDYQGADSGDVEIITFDYPAIGKPKWRIAHFAYTPYDLIASNKTNFLDTITLKDGAKHIEGFLKVRVLGKK